MEQESAYMQALETVTGFQILGDEMVMHDEAGQEVLKFKASDLVGYVWAWMEFLENNDTVTRPNMPANYTVEFIPDGQVAIQADCNQVIGTYSVKGNQIDIELGATTLAACPDNSLADEYLRLLSDAVIYFRQAEYLFLDIMMDVGTMKFFPIE
jgi:heat shock protein HslJ